MNLALILIMGALSASNIYGETFAAALKKNRKEIKVAIGEKKLQLIERNELQIELIRITQLLLIEGIGEKTVLALEKIIGTRFDDNFSTRTMKDMSW